jgi:hypothetical protein
MAGDRQATPRVFKKHQHHGRVVRRRCQPERYEAPRQEADGELSPGVFRRIQAPVAVEGEGEGEGEKRLLTPEAAWIQRTISVRLTSAAVEPVCTPRK